LRGQADDSAKLWQLVDLLSQQNALYADSLKKLQAHADLLRNALLTVAKVLKVEPGAAATPAEVGALVAGVEGAVGVLVEAGKKGRQVEVPIFVEREVERRVEVPVVVERVVEVEVERVV
jgi:hypothetical protein